MREIALGVGLTLLAATAHVTIMATGGYLHAHAVLTLAIAAGVGSGALAIGSAWASDRKALAVWLVIAILAGEAYGFVSTAERLVVARESAQAPLRAAGDAVTKAVTRVSNAEAAVTKAPETSPRLERALKAKATADETALTKAAERGCRDNCRALLQAQVDQAGQEVAAARADIEKVARAATDELEAARTAFAGLRPPASATPLADRLGIPPWVLDLLSSALGSMAANGLAAGLLCFAAHGRAYVSEPQGPQLSKPSQEVTVEAATVVPDDRHARRFALQCIQAGDGEGAANVADIRRAYLGWCASMDVAPMADADLATWLGDTFNRAGIPLEKRDGAIWAIGIKVVVPETAKMLTGPRLGTMHRRRTAA
jgi:hypothetical protein